MLLNFNTNLRNATTKLTSHISWRFAASFSTNPTSIFNPEPENVDDKEKTKETMVAINNTAEQKSCNKIADLKQMIQNSMNIESPVLLSQIKSANTLSDILNLIKLPNTPQESTIKLMTIVSEWMNSNNIDAKHLQKDKNMTFLENVEIKSKIRHSYLQNTNFKELEQLSIPKMIQAIRDLAEKRSRNVPLLRFFFSYITQNSEPLILGQCSLLLYCMCILHFPDEKLIKKLCGDICKQTFLKSTTMNNVITSIRMLRYKDEDFLNFFCEKMDSLKFTPQQLVNILSTFAVLNCKTEVVHSAIKKQMDTIEPAQLNERTWVDYVWALIVLGKAQEWHIENVLKSSFVDKLSENLELSMQLKLLNINAAAQYLLKNYNGPLLSDNSKILKKVECPKSESKKMYQNILSETLHTIPNAMKCFQQDVDSSMGYSWDAVYYVNSAFQPTEISQQNMQSGEGHRIAIMVHEYSSYCLGIRDFIGICELQTKLTKAAGYKVLNISYDNFSVEDRLSKRVQYLTSCIEELKRQSI